MLKLKVILGGYIRSCVVTLNSALQLRGKTEVLEWRTSLVRRNLVRLDVLVVVVA